MWTLTAVAGGPTLLGCNNGYAWAVKVDTLDAASSVCKTQVLAPHLVINSTDSQVFVNNEINPTMEFFVTWRKCAKMGNNGRLHRSPLELCKCIAQTLLTQA